MGLTDEVKKFMSKKFMEATAASCAMVAFANGYVQAEELAKLADFIRIDESLKVFELHEVIEVFDNYAQDFEFDFRIGREKALRAINKIKKNSDEARTLVLVCIAIASSDDELDDNEKEVIREICHNLELVPSEFDLQSKFQRSPKSPDTYTPDKIFDDPEWIKEPPEVIPSAKDKDVPEWMRDTSKMIPPDKARDVMSDHSKITKQSDKDKNVPEWMRDTSQQSDKDKIIPKSKSHSDMKLRDHDDSIPEWMKK